MSQEKGKGQSQGFGFGLGKMKELTNAFKKAQEGQEGAKKLQEELDKLELEGSAGGGLVKVFLSGNQEPRRVEISPDLLKEEADVVAELVTTAMKEAYTQSTSTMRSRMESLTNGLDMPKLS